MGNEMEPMSEVKAPFTQVQVETLNKFQRGGWFHPFTCRDRSDHPGDEGILLATEDGWHCPACDYTQNWAHTFMVDKEFVDTADARHKEQWAGWEESD